MNDLSPIRTAPVEADDRARLAWLARRCLALDPGGLGGLVLRARPGPVRDRFLADIAPPGLPLRRIHPGISDDSLFGGVDIAATLAAGKVRRSAGLFRDPATILLAMAERADAGLAAKLAQHLDGADGSCLVLIDEGAEPDETVPPALPDRLAFAVSLDGMRLADVPQDMPEPALPLHEVRLPDDAAEALVALAQRLGIDSLRAPLFALRCARAHAALHGRLLATGEDIAAAAALVYPSRVTRMPEEPEQDEAPEPETEQDRPEPESGNGEDRDLPSGDMLIEAVRALLPPGLLDRLKQSDQGTARAGAGAGQKRKGNRRGRPLPPRPGRLDGRARIDLVATLRAAAPWQPLRRKTRPDAQGLLIRPSDIRLKRFEEKSDRLLIFAVDASGSAAVSRLNEAKGAVELLLAEAYARRDHVALIAFRGEGAELLLPPTRSLVQTKRRLAALPGGGGTPLAAGLREAAALAEVSRAKGLTPTLVLMTDGRANITLDGRADREQAGSDADRLAGMLRARHVPGVVIDMSKRPHPALRALADLLGAPYLALPRADSRSMSQAVTGALGAL